MDISNKRQRGQYFTVGNPFLSPAFLEWCQLIKNLETKLVLEPFCGANNIPATLKEMGWHNNWATFDIEPQKDTAFPGQEIVKQDVLKEFPSGYSVAITNPPYLAKNSANRRGLVFPDTKHEDLYQVSLELMLKNVDFIAAIIPESFISQGIFHERLMSVVSLTDNHFADTEHPVCLALFVPEKSSSGFSIWRNSEKIGDYQELKKFIPKEVDGSKIRFNDKNGQVGIKCVDSISGASIKFVEGSSIDGATIKVSSRAITRVALEESLTPENLDVLLNRLNEKLAIYRSQTKDVFLTAFKGIRKDGLYRRRLDFNTAKNLINGALSDIQGK